MITDIVLEQQGFASVRATFTGVGYVYVNGSKIASAQNGICNLPFAADNPLALEVHDADVAATYIRLMRRPVIHWNRVATAAQYRIYHTPPGESERMIYGQMQDHESLLYSITCPVELTGGWHFFRVEAVDENGIESACAAWPHFVYDILALPSNIEISGAAGIFTISLSA